MSSNFNVKEVEDDESSDKLGIAGLDKISKITPLRPINITKEITILPRPCVLSQVYKNFMDRIYEFPVKESDVWIVTYPKCGTTWTQEMTWLIMNNYDFKTAKRNSIINRSPFLEFCGIIPDVPFDTISLAESSSDPRVIKSHLPMGLLPKELWIKKPKIIYVARDPKDAVISFLHHERGMSGYSGELDLFLDYFLDAKLSYTPFWPHVLEFWKLRDLPFVKFLTFERMKTDLKSVILECCQFLNKPITEDILEKMLEHLSFKSMKNNPAVNHEMEKECMLKINGKTGNSFNFIRKGEVGGYKEEFPEKYLRKFEKWTETQLKNSNFPFYSQ